jgi:hypothetical protein
MSKTLGLRQNDHTPSLLAGLKVCIWLELAFWDPDPLIFGSHGSGFVTFLGPPDTDPFICSSLSAISLSLVVIVTEVSIVADPDPGSCAFLTPGSGIRNRFFPDPGSQTHIF